MLLFLLWFDVAHKISISYLCVIGDLTAVIKNYCVDAPNYIAGLSIFANALQYFADFICERDIPCKTVLPLQ